MRQKTAAFLAVSVKFQSEILLTYLGILDTRLNSLESNLLEYHVWGTVQGLLQAPPKPKMVAELKEMLKLFTLSTVYTLRLSCARKLTAHNKYVKFGFEFPNNC